MTQPACPECEKLAKVAPQSNIIGDFLDWLETEKDVDISSDSMSGYYDKEKLLAEFFEIDLDLVETERQALLEYIRKNN